MKSINEVHLNLNGTVFGIRQRDVLSTLLFNVVLEAIVRRAKLQTTGTIFNKQAQLLAYADDIKPCWQEFRSRPRCLPSNGGSSSKSKDAD
jgi:hypothetical protein